MKPSADATALPAVVAGTLVWALALIALSVRGPIAPPENGVWWWGACAIGLASGAIGTPFLLRRRTRLAAATNR